MNLVTALVRLLARFERWLGPVSTVYVPDPPFLAHPGAIVPEREDRCPRGDA